MVCLSGFGTIWGFLHFGGAVGCVSPKISQEAAGARSNIVGTTCSWEVSRRAAEVNLRFEISPSLLSYTMRLQIFLLEKRALQ